MNENAEMHMRQAIEAAANHEHESNAARARKVLPGIREDITADFGAQIANDLYAQMDDLIEFTVEAREASDAEVEPEESVYAAAKYMHDHPGASPVAAFAAVLSEH